MLFRSLACKAEQEIKRCATIKCKKMVNVFASPPTVSEVSRDVDESPPTVPPSFETVVQGSSKGTDIIAEIDQCPIDLTMPCVEIPVDLHAPHVLDECVADLDSPCAEIISMPTVLSATIAETNSYSAMSAPIAATDSSTDSNAPVEINVENELCDMTTEYDLDHITLVRHDEVVDKIAHDTSLWSIMLDPPMFLSHAKNKIAEITCLKSIYAPDFTFNLVGEIGRASCRERVLRLV